MVNSGLQNDGRIKLCWRFDLVDRSYQIGVVPRAWPLLVSRANATVARLIIVLQLAVIIFQIRCLSAAFIIAPIIFRLYLFPGLMPCT